MMSVRAEFEKKLKDTEASVDQRMAWVPLVPVSYGGVNDILYLVDPSNDRLRRNGVRWINLRLP